MTTPPVSSAASAPWVTRDVRFILLTQLVFGFGWSLYLLLPKFMAIALHAGPELIGQIGAMGGAAGLLTVPLAGFAIDRLGRPVFFRVGACLLIALSIGFTQVERVGPLLYVLQGCVSAAFVLAFNATAALLADYAPPERLGQAIGFVGGTNVLMNAVGTMIAEPLAAEHGWRAVFALGICAGVAALALSLGLREAAGRPQRTAADIPVAGGPEPRLYLTLLVTLLTGAVFVAVFSFIQPYAVSVGATQVRGFFLGYTASAVAGRVFLGGLGDRVGRRVVSGWMLVGYAVSAFVVRPFSADLLVVYGFVFGAAHGILYPTLNALLLEALPAARRGLGMVLYNGAFNVGSSLGSLGWGMIAKQHGYPALYAAAGCVALAAAGLLSSGGGARKAP